jgi:hypothetical protein
MKNRDQNGFSKEYNFMDNSIVKSTIHYNRNFLKDWPYDHREVSIGLNIGNYVGTRNSLRDQHD